MKRRRIVEGVGGMALLAIAALVFACQHVGPLIDAGTQIGEATGSIKPEEAESIRRGTGAVVSATEAFTPEQEHFIGRAVAATVLSQYPALDNPVLNTYLNTLGQALARFSERPETFGGYRFLALDSDEINAFAAPGGFILITRGMIRSATSEAMLAAILAHEIAHVQHGHGLRAVRGSRVTSAVTILAAESARHLGSEELAELTGVFEDTIGDIGATLISNGYSRAYEREADREAVAILTRAGYPPHGLIDALAAIQQGQRAQPEPAGWAKTHPPPADRIRDIERLLRGLPRSPSPPEHQVRFNTATSAL